MKALPIVRAVNREVRVQSTEESSNGRVGSAQGISVGKKQHYPSVFLLNNTGGQNILVGRGKEFPKEYQDNKTFFSNRRHLYASMWY